MPQDAETRDLLLEVLNELKAVLKDHDARLRSAELTIARVLGGLGLLGFLLGIAAALYKAR